MNVLLIGGGGREHALAWKISASPRLGKLHAIPGSDAIAGLAVCPPIEQSDSGAILAYALENKIDLAVIGPEEPLARGLGDELASAGIKVFGPSRKGAMLEASKQFAKEFMARHGLPTAGFQVLYEAGYARQRIKENRKYPLVIKADGLAAGKGVRICADEGEALRAVEDLMEKRMFGYSGSKLVMEEHLTGREASVMALVDGNSYLMLPVSRDHKRLRDGNEGPNTGGMGAVAPVRLEDNVLETVRTEVLDRFIAGIKKDGIPFRGVIYAGIMLTPSGPKVLEFNVRLGDPETQCLLPLLDGDILELLSACAEGRLAGKKAGASGACASVVLSARGYPDAPEKGREISGLDDLPEGALVFHSGTRKADGKFVTCGGRVLAVSCRAATPEEAREKVYAAVKKIRFDGMHFRTDIGL